MLQIYKNFICNGVAIADEIDKFVEDFKGTGFYILEIFPFFSNIG